MFEELEYIKMTEPTLQQKYDSIKILKDDTRITIMLYLNVFNKLSFQEIKALTGKAKSTIHHHLQILLKEGIIKESPTPDDLHGSTKCYELAIPFPSFSPEEVMQFPEDIQAELILQIFEMGKFIFLYMGRILNLITNYIDKKVSSINQVENSTVLKNEISEVSSIVTDSTMAMLPLSRTLYKEYIKGVTHYYLDFVKKMGKPEFSKNLGDLCWIMFCGVPLGKVLKERQIKK